MLIKSNVDPDLDQLASNEASRTGSSLFLKDGISLQKSYVHSAIIRLNTVNISHSILSVLGLDKQDFDAVIKSVIISSPEPKALR